MTAGDVYRALWRHKVLILVLTAACVAATWYLTSREAKTYEASTLVRVQERGAAESFSALGASAAVAQTYANILGAGALDDRIRTSAESRVSARLVSDVSISANEVTDLGLIWISARGRHPVGTAAVANAAPGVLQGAARQYGTPSDEIVVVKQATVPGSPVAPHTSLNLVLAVVLGLIFNSGLVLIFEVLRDRLPDPEELEDALGYPVLASIPTLRLKPLEAVTEATPEGALERDRASVGQPRGAGNGPEGDGRS